MAFTVVADITPAGDALFYDPGFRAHVERCLYVLRTQNATTRVVDASLVHQFQGNFYGYLISVGVGQHLHHLYLRVNNMHSPEEFGRVRNANLNKDPTIRLIRPSDDAIQAIVSFYLYLKNYKGRAGLPQDPSV